MLHINGPRFQKKNDPLCHVLLYHAMLCYVKINESLQGGLVPSLEGLTLGFHGIVAGGRRAGRLSTHEEVLKKEQYGLHMAHHLPQGFL